MFRLRHYQIDILECGCTGKKEPRTTNLKRISISSRKSGGETTGWRTVAIKNAQPLNDSETNESICDPLYAWKVSMAFFCRHASQRTEMADIRSVTILFRCNRRFILNEHKALKCDSWFCSVCLDSGKSRLQAFSIGDIDDAIVNHKSHTRVVDNAFSTVFKSEKALQFPYMADQMRAQNDLAISMTSSLPNVYSSCIWNDRNKI